MRLVCFECGKSYSVNEARWRCDCGGFLKLEYDNINVDFGLNSHLPGLWKYKHLLPIKDDKNIVSFGEGFTPLIKEHIFGQNVYLKLEYLFPSGSYKDRGSTVLLSKVKELLIKEIVEDSSGNAGSSIAMYAAKAKIKAHIYVPKGTSKDKLTQILACGSNLVVVDGNRNDTYIKALRDVEEKGLYYASHAWNPYFFEGTKTFSFELFEQLGFVAPDMVILPVGNGTLLIGAYNGFLQLKEAGLIKKIPKIIAVQSENCSPIYYKINGVSTDRCFETLAEGIAIPEPVREKQIVQIINRSDGDVVVVKEKEILDALSLMLKKGFYIEPTSAAVIAALKNIKTVAQTVVLPLTGSGLKAGKKIERVVV